ncbi:Protein CBG23232 [Caenorhabditis briggsae]|uniref:RNA polymerase II-associated factor 1 homolog n=1 Tax=Caenorhabditis briggsae TaxID=6238 RepID=A8Y4E4_CAEBR|nr:Protein CBG23232 [Caenorhabditis briggsae]CAP39764.2 Protein CBG23232 [Caenorhabditis briggsae]
MSQNSTDAKRIEPPRKVDFMLKPRFTNNVPDVPFDAKFMPCPFVPLSRYINQFEFLKRYFSRFVEYKPSTVDRDCKHAIICDDDMGLSVDLIDLRKYDEDPADYAMDEKDNILLEDESASKMSIKRSAQHSKLVPWMRKTEYISTEFNRFGVTADRQETKLGYNLKKNQQVEDMYRDKQSQIDAINKTFEDVRKPVTAHHTKKNMKPVEECYIFPDFEHWKYLFTHVQFDGDTITTEFGEDEKRQAQESSVIKGMEYEDKKFAALFVPTIEGLTHMMEDLEMDRPFDPDQKYEFLLSREYDWKMEHVPPRDRDVFVFYQRGPTMQYNEIDSNVKMTRRRKMCLSRNSKLTIQYRPFNETETEAMRRREIELYEQPKNRRQERLERMEEEKEDGDSSARSSDSEDAKPRREKPPRSGSSSSASGESSDDGSPKKKKAISDSDSD